MSHDIVDNMLAYKGEVPWHGLGVNVEPTATGAEMLEVAKLNWPVQRRSIAMRTADGKSTLTSQLAGYKAIVRGDTNQVFQVASAGYHPMQNKEIVEYFQEYCEAGHATMHVIGGLRGGAVVWALAKLNGGSEDEIGPGDKVCGYMLMGTSHDGSVRTIAKATQVRVVCHNTLSAAIAEAFNEKRAKGKNSGVFMMKHTRKWTPEIAAEAKKTMGMAIEQVQKMNEVGRELSKVSIDDAGRLEYVTRILSGESLLEQIVNPKPSNLLDEIIAGPEEVKKELGRLGKAVLEYIVSSPGADLPTAKDTMWGALNGFTYFTDHIRGKSQDQRVYGALFGTGDGLKNRAVEIALQMAGKSASAVA